MRGVRDGGGHGDGGRDGGAQMIWIGEFAIGSMVRAVLVDSVTEKPLPLPCFESTEQAEGFMSWAEDEGVTVGQIPFATHTLDALHSLWVKQRRVA